MSSVKETTIEYIKRMPDDCSLEDIQYELYVKTKIEAGLKDVKEERVLSESEMDREMNSWLC